MMIVCLRRIAVITGISWSSRARVTWHALYVRSYTTGGYTGAWYGYSGRAMSNYQLINSQIVCPSSAPNGAVLTDIDAPLTHFINVGEHSSTPRHVFTYHDVDWLDEVRTACGYDTSDTIDDGLRATPAGCDQPPTVPNLRADTHLDTVENTSLATGNHHNARTNVARTRSIRNWIARHATEITWHVAKVGKYNSGIPSAAASNIVCPRGEGGRNGVRLTAIEPPVHGQTYDQTWLNNLRTACGFPTSASSGS